MDEFVKFLQDRIGEKTTLKEAVGIFEDMCRLPAEDDAVLFETGTYPYAQGDARFYFSLVRQIPEEDGEYEQIHLDVMYLPSSAKKKFRETKWDSDFKGNRAALFDYVRRSKAYLAVADEPFLKMEIYSDET